MRQRGARGRWQVNRTHDAATCAAPRSKARSKKRRIKDRTRKGLASALPGSGPKLVEDADALVLQETLTRFGLNSHHQRDLEVKRSEGPPAVDQAACHGMPTWLRSASLFFVLRYSVLFSELTGAVDSRSTVRF